MFDNLEQTIGNPERLAMLRALALLDAPEDDALARLTHLAATLLGAPTALITLVDADRQFFAAATGVPETLTGVRETPLPYSICQYVVGTRVPLVVGDLRTDPFFSTHPAVTGLGLGAYAGVPLFDTTGQALGSFCAVDYQPRNWTDEQMAILRDLASLTQDQFAFHRLTQIAWKQGEDQEALLNAIVEGIWVTDDQGRCTFVNDAGAALLGMTPTDLLGQPLHEVVAPLGIQGQPIPAAEWPLLGPLRGLGRMQVAGELLCRNDTEITIEYCSVPIAAGDKVSGLVATVRDITALVRGEAELRASARRFRAVFAEAGFGIWLIDIDGYLVEVNRAFVDFIGYSQEELTKLTIADITHPDDIAVNVASRIDLLSGQLDSFQIEKRYIRKDGSIIWGLLTASAIRDDHGQPLYTVGMVEDITARKSAEDALIHSAESFTSIFNAAGEPLIICDGLKILSVNDAYRNLVGHTFELLDGQLLATSSAVLADWVAQMAATLVTPEVVELELDRADGTTVPVEVSRKAIRYQGKAATLISLRNIAQRRAVQAELETSRRNLSEAQRIAHLGSWEYTFESKELHLSDEVYRIGGLVNRNISGYKPSLGGLLAVIHPDDREHAAAAFQQREAGITLPDIDYRIVRPDGEVRIVHQRSEVLRDEQGHPQKLVGTAMDVTDQRRLESWLAHQATHDSLTGLPNRHFFLEQLEASIAQARSSGSKDVVFFLDIDNFKYVNDTRGHDKGDRLLIAVAERLQQLMRREDTLARLDGDEFVVLLRSMQNVEAAQAFADRLLADLAIPLWLDGDEQEVAASIGLVLVHSDYLRAEDVLRDADVAMYHAKAEGRAQSAIFDPAMQDELRLRLRTERDLSLAIGRDELEIYYQPKVNLATGEIVLLEALLRWHHPERGMISPGEFIPIAERTGLIVPIGRWALEAACRQFKDWESEYPLVKSVGLAVNLSPRQFRDPDLLATVAGILDTTGFAPTRLVLEVTESVAMERVEETITTLKGLGALGIRLALDDFGTGHSALAYLHQLPLNTLKIDRSFFRESPANRAIVSAVTNLAHGIGLDVTAEGLETAQQVAWARSVGCDRGQGYFFSRPVNSTDIAKLWSTSIRYDLPTSDDSASIADLVELTRAD